jgi:hypothetical protein
VAADGYGLYNAFRAKNMTTVPTGIQMETVWNHLARTKTPNFTVKHLAAPEIKLIDRHLSPPIVP